MVKNKNALNNFIDDIPASKLTGLPKIFCTIYKEKSLRLDWQGLTTGSKRYNLLIQVNKETEIPKYKNVAPRLVAKAEPPVSGTEWTAEEVRKELVKGIVVFR